MTNTKILDIDCYNFPDQGEIGHMLYFLGQDYLEYIVKDLKRRISHPISGLKCEEKPEFKSTVATARENRLKNVQVVFVLQMLVQSGEERHSRIFIEYTLHGVNLIDGPEIETEINVVKQVDL